MGEDLTNFRNDYKHISEEQINARTNLEKQITTIEIRQQELQSYMTTVDNNIKQLELVIIKEERCAQPDANKLRNLRSALITNVDLNIRIYETYNKFEDTKLKCRKEINDSTHKVRQLIEVSIRQIDQKLEKLTDNDFINTIMKLSDMMSNINVSGPSQTMIMESQAVLESDPDLEM